MGYTLGFPGGSGRAGARAPPLPAAPAGRSGARKRTSFAQEAELPSRPVLSTHFLQPGRGTPEPHVGGERAPWELQRVVLQGGLPAPGQSRRPPQTLGGQPLTSKPRQAPPGRIPGSLRRPPGGGSPGTFLSWWPVRADLPPRAALPRLPQQHGPSSPGPRLGLSPAFLCPRNPPKGSLILRQQTSGSPPGPLPSKGPNSGAQAWTTPCPLAVLAPGGSR